MCDKLLVCTYDYQNEFNLFLYYYLINKFRNNNFAISPIEWVRENVEYFLNDLDISNVIISKKILMVLNNFRYYFNIVREFLFMEQKLPIKEGIQ